MKYCTKCGKELMDEAVICIGCGCLQNDSTIKAQDNTNGFWWGLLGFFVPIAGLILYFVWKNEAPYKAKSAGIGALIGIALEVIFFIFYVAVIAVTFANFVSMI